MNLADFLFLKMIMSGNYTTCSFHLKKPPHESSIILGKGITKCQFSQVHGENTSMPK